MKRKLSPENYANFLYQECQKYGIVEKEDLAPLIEKYMLNPTDRSSLWIIELALAEAKQLQQTYPDPFRPTNPINEGVFTGNLLLGAIPPEGLPYLIPLELLKTHMLVTSRTGGGKTNLNFVILTQILESRKNVDDI